MVNKERLSCLRSIERFSLPLSDTFDIYVMFGIYGGGLFLSVGYGLCI